MERDIVYLSTACHRRGVKYLLFPVNNCYLYVYIKYISYLDGVICCIAVNELEEDDELQVIIMQRLKVNQNL
jgi:hypothetical protein